MAWSAPVEGRYHAPADHSYDHFPANDGMVEHFDFWIRRLHGGGDYASMNANELAASIAEPATDKRCRVGGIGATQGFVRPDQANWVSPLRTTVQTPRTKPSLGSEPGSQPRSRARRGPPLLRSADADFVVLTPTTSAASTAVPAPAGVMRCEPQ